MRDRFTALIATLRAPPKADPAIGNWCLILAVMVFGMVIGGGHVRTIDAGFSIQVWRPITGFIPPMTAADWNDLFFRYQNTAQFHADPFMTLDQYKALFWPMFLDRCWGRLMALVFLLPGTWFLITGRLRGRPALWMLLIFCAGVFEAIYGWYMVMLGDLPNRVLSPPPDWAAPHFCVAMLIFAFLLWIGLTFRTPVPAPLPDGGAKLRRWTSASIVLLFITMGFGALVATTNAVTVYNSFPKMDGYWLPPAIFAPGPFWQNQALVQFCHRLLATITVLTILATVIAGLRTTLTPALRDNFLLLAGLVALQYMLGMTTIVLASNNLGYVHELTAVLLFATAICARHKLRGAPQGVHP